MKVLIAGAGIAGITAGLNFARRGARVDIFEKAHKLEDVGAGIQLSPNAMHVLAFLQLDKQLESLSFEPLATSLRHYRTGTPYFTTKMKGVYEKRYGAKYLHVHRADLIKVLYENAKKIGVRFHLGETVKSYQHSGNKIKMHLQNADIHTGDLLVGADGFNSNLRGIMFGSTPPRFTKQVAWRGLVEAEKIPHGTIPFDTTAWLGPHQHFVSYYLRGGKVINFVAVKNQTDWVEESWNIPGHVRDIQHAFAAWNPSIQTLLQSCEQCFLWGLFDRPPLARWFDGAVVLIGDACHPMLPFMAQGGAMAMEDGYLLARQIMTHKNQRHALNTYQKLRQSRVAWIQSLSKANAKIFHAAGFTGEMKKRLLYGIGKHIPPIAMAPLDKIYGLNVTSPKE